MQMFVIKLKFKEVSIWWTKYSKEGKNEEAG